MPGFTLFLWPHRDQTVLIFFIWMSASQPVSHNPLVCVEELTTLSQGLPRTIWKQIFTIHNENYNYWVATKTILWLGAHQHKGHSITKVEGHWPGACWSFLDDLPASSFAPVESRPAVNTLPLPTPVRGQILNISGFASHMVSVNSTTQLFL